MARVTVEDCVEYVSNRFELVVLAATRAKSIYSGTPISVERDNDKNPVIALREIASGNMNVGVLRKVHINSLQKKSVLDDAQLEDLHAETQETIGEAIVDDPETDDVFSSGDQIGQSIDMDFSDEISDELKTK